MIVEVVNLRNNQILINFLSEAWEPIMACGEIKHECNSNADCKMGTQCVQTSCAALCKGESGMNSDCEVSFTQKILWFYCNRISFYLSAISCPRQSPSSSCLYKGSSELNPIKSNKYLCIESFYYLLIPNLGYISLDSLYKL